MSITSEQKNELIKSALTIREQAYVPYSNFQVGAAILTAEGQVFTGVNFENASYGLTICAERNAVGQMVTAGGREIAAVAVSSDNGVTPCGACRQVMIEFRGNRDAPVWLISEDDGSVRETTLAALMPDSFDQNELGQLLNKD